VPPFVPGNTQAQVSVTTSSTNLPLIAVGVWAIVQPQLAVIPPQVTLPPAPLTARTLPMVTIQNNSTNLITLSDPAFPIKNVDLSLKQIIPGRAYSVTLAFPAGFELPAGEAPVLTLKSSLPAVPLIHIPVLHLPKPAPLPKSG